MRINKAFAADGLPPINASNTVNAHFLPLQTGENIPNNTLGRERSGGKQREALQRKASPKRHFRYALTFTKNIF